MLVCWGINDIEHLLWFPLIWVVHILGYELIVSSSMPFINWYFRFIHVEEKQKKREKKEENKSKQVIGIKHVNSLCSFFVSFLVLNSWRMFIVLLGFGVLVNFIVAWWFVGCSLVTCLNSSTLRKFIGQLLSFNPFIPHYNPCKLLLIVLCTLHF